MFKLVVCLSVLAIAAAQLPIPAYLQQGLIDNTPQPYSYAYSFTDEFGTFNSREETSDGNGNVRGSWSYREANGIGRTTEYIVDPVNGYRANVITNEPGTVSSSPAAVNIRNAN